MLSFGRSGLELTLQVAEQLVISPRTVNGHLRSIYNKINVNSRSAATRYAIELLLASDETSNLLLLGKTK